MDRAGLLDPEDSAAAEEADAEDPEDPEEAEDPEERLDPEEPDERRDSDRPSPKGSFCTESVYERPVDALVARGDGLHRPLPRL